MYDVLFKWEPAFLEHVNEAVIPAYCGKCIPVFSVTPSGGSKGGGGFEEFKPPPLKMRGFLMI